MNNRVGYKRTNRRGMALIAVLVFTAIILILVTAMTKALTREHRQGRVAENQLQAFWLVESAAQRAAASLRDTSDYSGETWNVPADVFGRNENGVVVIRVEEIDDRPGRRLLRIEACYPDDPLRRVLEVREFELSTSGES